jgi:hypothetical protein
MLRASICRIAFVNIITDRIFSARVHFFKSRLARAEITAQSVVAFVIRTAQGSAIRAFVKILATATVVFKSCRTFAFIRTHSVYASGINIRLIACRNACCAFVNIVACTIWCTAVTVTVCTIAHKATFSVHTNLVYWAGNSAKRFSLLTFVYICAVLAITIVAVVTHTEGSVWL